MSDFDGSACVEEGRFSTYLPPYDRYAKEQLKRILADGPPPVIDGTLYQTKVKAFAELERDPRFQTARYIDVFGGYGSGKSASLAMMMCEKMCKETGKTFLISRFTGRELKDTIYRGDTFSIINILDAWHVPYTDRKGDAAIEINGNRVLFRSIDEPHKLRSLNLNYAWLDECNEFPLETFKEVDRRVRAPTRDGHINQIFLSSNPSHAYHWSLQMFYSNPVPAYKSRSLVHISSPLNNPFLGQDYIDTLLNIGELNENEFKIGVLGQPGVPEGLVYHHFEFLPEGQFPAAVWQQEPVFGIDFGWQHPMVVSEGRELDDVWYIRQRVYKSHLEIAELLDHMNRCNEEWHAKTEPKKVLYQDRNLYEQDLDEWEHGKFMPNARDWQIYGFAAPEEMVPTSFPKGSFVFTDHDPEKYVRIYRAGWSNTRPANKNVDAGIGYVKAHRVIISSESTDLISEAQTYSYKPSKGDSVNGNDVEYEDDVIKVHDDGMDSIRYIIASMELLSRGGYVGEIKGDEDTDYNRPLPPSHGLKPAARPRSHRVFST